MPHFVVRHIRQERILITSSLSPKSEYRLSSSTSLPPNPAAAQRKAWSAISDLLYQLLGLATATEYPSLSLPALCRQRNIPPNHKSAWERQSDGTSLCPLVAERLLAANTRGTSCLLASCSAQPVGDNSSLSQPHGLTEGHEKCAR